MSRRPAGLLTRRCLVAAFVTALLSVAAIGPACFVADAGAGGRALEGPVWTATHIRGVKKVLPLEAFRSTAEFTGRSVTGCGAVNSYGARYRASNDGAIHIAGPVSTLIAGPLEADAQERAFFKALARATTFRISGDTLKLRGPHGGLLVAFVASPAPSLTGRRWSALAVADGEGGLRRLVAGSEITAQFGTDGRLGGRASVNQYGTVYTIGPGGAVAIDSRIVSTEMAGPPELMLQERAYLESLPRAAAYLVEGDELWLRDAGGAVLAHFAAR